MARLDFQLQHCFSSLGNVQLSQTEPFELIRIPPSDIGDSRETERLKVTSVGVLAIAYIQDQPYVIIVNPTEENGKVRWDFPSGRVEATDTSVAVAASRELLEETGFVPMGNVYPLAYIPKPNKSPEVVLQLLTLVDMSEVVIEEQDEHGRLFFSPPHFAENPIGRACAEPLDLLENGSSLIMSHGRNPSYYAKLLGALREKLSLIRELIALQEVITVG